MKLPVKSKENIYFVVKVFFTVIILLFLVMFLTKLEPNSASTINIGIFVFYFVFIGGRERTLSKGRYSKVYWERDPKLYCRSKVHRIV